jgi:hypothetical protein
MARLIGHLLLVLCLVLNGIGGAATAATTTLPHGMAASPSVSENSEEGCHDQLAPFGPEADSQSLHPAPANSDCCDPERCDGACAQHAVAVPEFLSIFGTDDLGLGYRVAAVPGHLDPALRRAVRPPIA